MQAFLNGVDISGLYQPEEMDQIGLTLIADMAEVGTGQFPQPDDDSSLVYYSGAEFQLHDGAVPILNGYTGADVVGRGTTASGTTGARRLPVITVSDENAYLWGARAYNWHRPAETDRARVLAFKAKFLPDVNTTWVLNTHLKDMPAKTYTTEEIVTDILGDLADVTGKTMFVVNRDLHWHLYTEGDTAGLAISDDDTEYDYVTTFPPYNPTVTRDPSEIRNNVLAYNDKGQTYRFKDAASLARYDSHIRHQGLVSVPNGSLAGLEARAKGIVSRASDARTSYECDIGPLTAAQFALIPKGSLISVTSSVMGLDHSTQRVAQIDVKYKNPGQYFLHLTFSYPIRRVAAPAPAPPVTKPVPFVPGTGTITFIQAAKTADGTAAGDATFPSPAAAGNFLVMVTEPDQPGGATPSWDVILPDGWIRAVFSDGIADDSGAGTVLGRMIASTDAAGGETLEEVIWGATGTISDASPKNGMVVMAEYEASDALVLQDVIPFVAQDDGLGASALPPVTPTPGATALIVHLVAFHPNYIPTVSAGWNIRGVWNATGGSRLILAYVDRIIVNAQGSYTGTITSPGGTDSSGWVIGTAVYEMGGDVPAYGQPVGPESAISDGSTTAYTTNFPYMAGSIVVKVNGVIVTVAETDPDNGLFTLPAAPPAGALITWTYLGQDGAPPTGASNPPPPAPPPGSVPSDPGTVQGGDGTYRQPQAMFVPAEAPDGAITVFTIAPYIAGTTLVYINGLIQRRVTDYAETSPSTGVITFVEAPAATDQIIVLAMPATAVPPGGGGGSARPFPAPVTTATYTIPGTIDATGATEVGAAVDAWIATVPDHSVLDFAGATLQMHQGMQLPSGRHHLYYDLTGATIVATAGTTGADQLNSQMIVGHQRGGSWSPAHAISDIVFDGGHFIGNNSAPGVFTSGDEAAANLEITGVDRIEIKNGTYEQAWGDALFVEDVTNLWMHDYTVIDAGRDGVSVISGDTILVEQGDFGICGQNIIDVEPNVAAQACYRVTVQDFIGTSFGNEFLGVEGTHTGAPIDTITVTRGVMSSGSLRSTVDNGGALGTRMKNISLTNCVGAGTIAGPAVDFHHVDNPTASGNVQALSSGSFASFADCTNPVT